MTLDEIKEEVSGIMNRLRELAADLEGQADNAESEARRDVLAEYAGELEAAADGLECGEPD